MGGKLSQIAMRAHIKKNAAKKRYSSERLQIRKTKKGLLIVFTGMARARQLHL